ncbi:hypothetical protein FB639_003947, partial [Coemansia asiatica]
MSSSKHSEKPTRVVAEEEFKETLSQIIQRDFFPDLPKLQMENHKYEEDEEEKQQAHCSTVSTAPAKMSLNGYLSTYTTEDNASFRKILDNENNRRREKHKSMICKQPGDLSSESKRSSTMLLVPEDTSGRLIERYTDAGGRIVYENTRFAQNGGFGGGIIEDRVESDTEESGDSESGDKATPVIGGYRLIREPSTPLLGKTRHRGFAIRAETPRERIGRAAKKTKKVVRDNSRVPKGVLSPAAQRLLLRSSSGSNSPSIALFSGKGADNAGDGGPGGLLRK